eukprot:FR735070.1.p2 GENE.FR735070.1~~FR735070.1.p2  ORF type:complete len:107 (+),score=16.25 FR735070.1:307-627(+)
MVRRENYPPPKITPELTMPKGYSEDLRGKGKAKGKSPSKARSRSAQNTNQNTQPVDNAANNGHPRQCEDMLDYHQMMDPELEEIEAPREKDGPWGLVDFLLCGCDR